MKNNSSIIFIIQLFLLACIVPNALSCQEIPGSNTPKPALDPEKEDGLHSADLEWWYHFGLLKAKGAPDYSYSFISSFQRNNRGRNLFYTLADLKTGKVYFAGRVDRSVMYNSPFLPKGYQFLEAPTEPCPPPRSELWLCYGDNNLHKQDSTYRVSISHDSFSLQLHLQKQGPPMLVMGNGMMGLNKPEDILYYSYPRVTAAGRLNLNGTEIEVAGDMWYDHQWGEMAKKLLKWAWWGIRLDNGQNINVYYIQNALTNKVLQKGMTLQHPDGRTEVFTDLKFIPLRKWKSPDSGRKYIVDWKITVPETGLELTIKPINDDHELPALVYGKIWEGPCTVEASGAKGEKSSGWGFQEIIGKITNGNAKK